MQHHFKMQDTVVLYPSPDIGHLISVIELAKLILKHNNQNFSVTIFLITSEWDNPKVTSYINKVSQTIPRISFHSFPYVSVDATPIRSRAAMLFDCIRLNATNVLKNLVEISKTSNIKALVIDFFCTSALSIGIDLKIPTYYFFASGAASLSAFLYLPRIHEKHAKSFKDLTSTTLYFPCIPALKAIHVPEPLLDRDDPAYWDFIYFCSHLPKAQGILVNTFDDLEPKVLKALADGVCTHADEPTPPVHRIGPLIAGSGDADDDDDDIKNHDCLVWLDKQPDKSVVFLCFGSRGSFSKEQVKEIACGLERSGHRFLWVVKNVPSNEGSKQTEDPSDFDLESVLPEGFLKRLGDRAMVVKAWVPQVKVLSHNSVGGFVTHCGWNSVLEAVVAGVPMVAWPLYAEQHLNRNVLVEDMRMAIAVEQRDQDGYVSADELEKRVRELMESENGRELKERSRDMREKSFTAMSGLGSSTRAIAKLVEIWQLG